MLLDGGRTFKGHYGGGYIPRVFWIDRSGTIVDTHLGFEPGDVEKFEKMIEKML